MSLQREICSLLGAEAAEALSRRYGGTYLYVPRRYTAGHRLTLLLGEEAAVKLNRRYSGWKMYIAKHTKAHQRSRNSEIRREFDDGAPAAKLARKYGLSERHIHRILTAAER